MTTVGEQNEIVEVMIEVELYIKYQCYSQAQELLDGILNQMPDYLPAKEALQTIYRKKGNNEKANEIAREIALIKAKIAEQRNVREESGAAQDQVQKRRLTEKIDTIIREIYDSSELAEILKVSSNQLLDNLHSDRCLVVIQDKAAGQAKIHEFCKKDIPSCLDPTVNRLNQLLLRKGTRGFDPVVIDETMKDPSLVEYRPVLEQYRIQSVLAHPLVYKSTLIGFVIIHRCTRPVQWSEQEKTLFSTVSGHLAVAIGNAEQLTEIQAMAFTDKLTGIYNRRFLEERLSAELRNARQQKYPLSLAILDVDHFKKVNDTYGHATGDKVLQKLGYLLKTHLRKGDMVARFGGEEFAILLPNTSKEIAHRILDNIRRLVESSVAVEPGSPITVSAGIMEVSPQDPQGLAEIQNEMIQKADANLYRAKRSGRNTVCSGTDFETAGKANSL